MQNGPGMFSRPVLSFDAVGYLERKGLEPPQPCGDLRLSVWCLTYSAIAPNVSGRIARTDRPATKFPAQIAALDRFSSRLPTAPLIAASARSPSSIDRVLCLNATS